MRRLVRHAALALIAVIVATVGLAAHAQTADRAPGSTTARGTTAGMTPLTPMTPLTIARPNQSLTATGFGAKDPLQVTKLCPDGYVPTPESTQNLHLVVCVVDGRAFNQCAAVSGYYQCGRNALECCPIGTNNLCFPGAFACAAPDAYSRGGHSACCISR